MKKQILEHISQKYVKILPTVYVYNNVKIECKGITEEGREWHWRKIQKNTKMYH